MKGVLLLAGGALAAVLGGCQEAHGRLGAEPAPELAAEGGHAPPISPIPRPDGAHPGRVALGRKLFHDPRLSADGTVSCSSCHDLSRGGDDGRRHSIGIGGVEGGVNAPTVYNAALNPRQFWDGRATSLEEQIDGPVQHPAEMGSRWEDVVTRLSSDRVLEAEFYRVYSDGVTAANVRHAIAEFERSLVTPDSDFDRFLRGDADAISEEAERGYQLFVSYGCVSCHQGANVGGNMFQTFGIVGDYFGDRGVPPSEADLGRFNVTGREEDRHVFRVPSLRMVVHTAPYLHDGSVASLDDAIAIMARYQLGRDIPAAEREAIRAFLATLSPMPQTEASRAP